MCKDWKARVDRYVTSHVEVKDFWIQIPGERPYFRGLLGRADVGLAVASCLCPRIHLGLSRDPLYYSLDLGKDVLRDLGPEYLFRTVEILDYSLGSKHVHPSLGLKIFQQFPKLHTIRLNVDFSNLKYIHHVDRIIFKDRPKWTVDGDRSKAACTPDCTRLHVRKIVVNINIPDIADPNVDGTPFPYESGVQEVVLIFHAWPFIPEVLRNTGEEGCPQDLRFTARVIAAAAMVAGARVTVVNVDQRDLITGEKTGNFPDAEDPEEELEHLIRVDLKDFKVGYFFGRPGQLRFLSTERYVAEVGVKEFEIESGERLHRD